MRSVVVVRRDHELWAGANRGADQAFGEERVDHVVRHLRCRRGHIKFAGIQLANGTGLAQRI